MSTVIHEILPFPQYGTRRLTSKPDSAGAKPVFVIVKERKGNATEYGRKCRIMLE